MKRRAFISAVGAVAALPRTTQAQQKLPLIGFLHSAAPAQYTGRVTAFRKGLAEAGLVEGRTVEIDFRWAEGQNERLAGMTAELIRRPVNVIVTLGSTDAAIAAKKATSTIPIVFAVGYDPVALGLVASLNRPGGNATGATSQNGDIAAKRAELIRDLIPQQERFFVLVNPDHAQATQYADDVRDVSGKLGLKVEVLGARNDSELDAAFASLPPTKGKLVLLQPDPFFYTRRARIGELAARVSAFMITDDRVYVESGALLSFGSDWHEIMRLAGGYAARILRGEVPAGLPVVQASKFEMVVNLGVARKLGLAISPLILARADEVLE